jgi:MFS family permease
MSSAAAGTLSMMNTFQSRLINRFPALASRDFIIFLAGQFISIIGTWMQSTAQPYLAYRISGRPFDLGLIGFAASLPTLILGLPAGVLVEHLDKRKAVIFFQAIMAVLAFALAALTFTGAIQIWHIGLISFLFGTASTVEITARQAMLIELTGREALPSAIALQTTAFNVGRVFGPTLAAPFMAAGTEGTAFLLNGFSFLFVIAGLLVARTRYPIEREHTVKMGIREEFGEGVAYIRQNGVVAGIIVMAALVGFFGMPLLQQIPTLGRDVLHAVQDTEKLIAERTSQLYIAQGIGALAAALMTAYFSAARRKGMLLTLGQVSFIAAMLALGFTNTISPALLLLAWIGWGSVTQLVMMNTMIQIQVPNGLRGRVFGAYLWALQGVAPFGSLLVGWMVQHWGLRVTMLACGGVLLFSYLLIHLKNPHIRLSQA